MTAGFTVSVGTYTGPFDLLLTLIEKRKLSVSDVSLSQVADDYLAYLKGKDAFPVEETSQFVVVAATVLLLKSKALLPELSLSEEETFEADELARRLALYQLYRECAQGLSRAFGRTLLHRKRKAESLPATFLPTSELVPDALSAVALALVESREQERERLPEVTVEPTITIEEAMARLAERVARFSSSTFAAVHTGAKKVEAIVHFLALLELVKQGVLEAEQATPESDITFTRSAVLAPHYGG